MKLLLDFYKFLASKTYGVGDTLPKEYSLGELDSLDVYKSKKMIRILSEITSESSIRKLDASEDKSKVSAN